MYCLWCFQVALQLQHNIKIYKTVQLNFNCLKRLIVFCPPPASPAPQKDFITLSNLCKTTCGVLVYFYIALNYSFLVCFNLFNFLSITICFQKFLWTLFKNKASYYRFKTNPQLLCTGQKFSLLMRKKFFIFYHFLALTLHFYVNSSNSVTLFQF